MQKLYIGNGFTRDTMDAEERFQLVKRNSEEVVTEQELMELLKEKDNPTAYIGFEPSGFMHIAQGLICARKIKDMQEAGFTVKIFLADWHAFINDKLGGEMENIRVCGEYMKDAFLSLGIDPEKTEFVWASDIITPDYWEKVLRIAKVSSLARVRRALTIMGRKESEVETDVSKLIYPPMQAADIFQLDVDVAYGGMDQRKAHMLARDAAEKLGWRKPIALHTPLISGLKGGGRMDATNNKDIENLYWAIRKFISGIKEYQHLDRNLKRYMNDIGLSLATEGKKWDAIKEFFNNEIISKYFEGLSRSGIENLKKLASKYFELQSSYRDILENMSKMSKSDPDSSILIHDAPEDIKRKIKKAYCPEGIADGNPIMDIARHIVFPWKGELLIERPEKWGGNLEFKSYDELEKVFIARELHPMDLKSAVANALIDILEPVREYFKSHPDNLEMMKAIAEKVNRNH